MLCLGVFVEQIAEAEGGLDLFRDSVYLEESIVFLLDSFVVSTNY